MSTTKTRFCSGAPVVTSLIAATYGLAPTPISASDKDLVACGGLVGTYVTTITDREGVFSSRGLMTFTSDGLLLMSDSAQGGVPGVWDRFSTSQGAWSCLATDSEGLSISAVGLNFLLPADGRTPSFGRVDYRAGLDTKTGTLSGSATLSFSSDKDLEGAAPLGKPGPVVDEFHFDGERLVPKK